MTTQKRTTIPEGVPQWPDVERALVTLLTGILADLTPAGYACVVLPENVDQRVNRDGQTIVQVQRAGGFADRIQDHARVVLSVTSNDRSVSWNVLGWLRPQLHQFTGIIHNGDGTAAIIQNIEDTQGPQRTPSPTAITTTVQATLTVTTRIER